MGSYVSNELRIGKIRTAPGVLVMDSAKKLA